MVWTIQVNLIFFSKAEALNPSYLVHGKMISSCKLSCKKTEHNDFGAPIDRISIGCDFPLLEL